MYYFLYLLVCLTPLLFVGIIKDIDGFVNVKSTPESTINITDKLPNYFVVYAFNAGSNWINVDYKKNGAALNGYIYKDRIKYISDFKTIPLKSNHNGKAILENEIVKIEITETDFIKENHKLTYHKNQKSQLDKIDDLKIFGKDGELPTRQYKSITVEFKEAKIQLASRALANLYEPSLFNSTANYDEVKNVLYISSSNSDGAGGYEVIWIIENYRYKSRIEAFDF